MANKRADIVAAISTKLAAIATTGGYLTNAGAKVTTWESKQVQENDEFLDIRDLKSEFDQEYLAGATNQQRNLLTVEIHIVATSKGTGAPAYIRQVISDVLKAIGTDDTLGKSYVTTTKAISDDMEFQQDERIAGSAVMTLQVDYVTTKWEN